MIELEVYINDALCGVLSYDSSMQRWALTYDSQWVVRKDAFPLGPTLPLALAEDRSPEEQSQPCERTSAIDPFRTKLLTHLC